MYMECEAWTLFWAYHFHLHLWKEKQKEKQKDRWIKIMLSWTRQSHFWWKLEFPQVTSLRTPWQIVSYVEPKLIKFYISVLRRRGKIILTANDVSSSPHHNKIMRNNRVDYSEWIAPIFLIIFSSFHHLFYFLNIWKFWAVAPGPRNPRSTAEHAG